MAENASLSQQENNRNVEILYSLAEIYYSMHLINLVEDTVIPFSSRDEVKTIVNKKTDASAQMKEVMSSTVVDDFKEAALKFTDLKTLAKRMKHRKLLEAQFVGNRIGWFVASFIKVESDSEGRAVKVLFTTRSIDEEKRKEENLINESNTDELTGFYNRRAYDMTAKYFAKNGLGENFVYVSIDINGLKVVNDTIGHGAGDELILGACDCMKKAFSDYGKLYRVGGDEFVAILSASENELELIKEKLKVAISSWKGQLVDSVSMSCGYVVKSETINLALHDISVLADKRMYEDKSRYYRQAGFDRRGQRDAHVALCALYTKILKISLTDDSYQIINIDKDEQREELGFSLKVSEWLHKFGEAGLIHPDDLEDYYRKTDFSFIREHFKNSTDSLMFTYRRKYGKDYRKVMMEIIPANDYSETSQYYFLYVKKIE
ncbi:MAG: GGDEF domain-containing protein [Treponema sp.]|nr:GGDEF domain-containing protein [Treponema sp.]